MGSLGTHRSYLQQGNFNDLDEFDEEVLNDSAVQNTKSKSSQPDNNTLESRVHAMELTAPRVDVDSREGAQFIRGVKNLLNTVEDERLQKRLRKILNQLGQ